MQSEREIIDTATKKKQAVSDFGQKEWLKYVPYFNMNTRRSYVAVTFILAVTILEPPA